MRAASVVTTLAVSVGVGLAVAGAGVAAYTMVPTVQVVSSPASIPTPKPWPGVGYVTSPAISAVTGGNVLHVAPSGDRTVANVELVAKNAPAVKLTHNADGSWDSAMLDPSTNYTLRVNIEGIPRASYTETFTTAAPDAEHTLSVSLSPDGGTFGIGQVVTAQFSAPIPQASRAEVLKHLRVSGGVGAWHWTTDSSATYRPEKFWAGHKTITTTANLKGITLTGTGEDGTGILWGNPEPSSTSWATGRALIVNINSADHSGSVVIDGKTVKTFGVSTGRDGFITRSGIKTITDTYESKRMTNAGVTDEVYDLDVPYAMRITDSGEFLHGAPWNSNIGYDNTSHGCTNLDLDVSQWIYSTVLYGDPVVTTGTDRSMEYDNGPGAVWNMPWAEWKN